MKLWFFVLVTLALMMAAPRAAGAGVEVTGLGGLSVLSRDVGEFGAGMLRVHVLAGRSASYGFEGGYGWLASEAPPYTSNAMLRDLWRGPVIREARLAWLNASVKGRGAPVGGGRLFLLAFAGVADHMTRGPFSSETVHNGRFMMGFGGGVEGAGTLGPTYELRVFSTGLEDGSAIGAAVNVGIRFAP